MLNYNSLLKILIHLIYCCHKSHKLRDNRPHKLKKTLDTSFPLSICQPDCRTVFYLQCFATNTWQHKRNFRFHLFHLNFYTVAFYLFTFPFSIGRLTGRFATKWTNTVVVFACIAKKYCFLVDLAVVLLYDDCLVGLMYFGKHHRTIQITYNYSKSTVYHCPQNYWNEI